MSNRRIYDDASGLGTKFLMFTRSLISANCDFSLKLDTLIVMKEHDAFADAVSRLQSGLTFQRDLEVSVFEASIRVLGGLLSAHQLALEIYDGDSRVYDGRSLLDHAEDLVPIYTILYYINMHNGAFWSGV